MFFRKEEICLSSDDENFSYLLTSPLVPSRSVTNAKYSPIPSRTTSMVNYSSSSTTSRSVVKKEPSGEKSSDLVTPDKDTKKKQTTTI